MNLRPGKIWSTALLIFTSAFLFYWAGMARGVATDDSAELQNLLPFMDRLHAPGYPLQLLIGKAATSISPWDDAYTVALLSPLAAAAALTFFFLSFVLLTGSLYNGFGAALVLALTHTFWMQACLPEVYALHAAFLTGLFALFALALAHPRYANRAFLTSALLLGVGSGNHLTLILTTPVFIVCYLYAFPITRRIRSLFGFGALGLFGVLSIYSVLAIRYGQLDHDLYIKNSGKSPLEFAIWWATGGPAQQHLFSFGVMDLVRRLFSLAKYTAYQCLTPAVFLIPLGIRALRGSQPWRLWMMLVGGCGGALGLYALNFDSSDVYVFYIPVYLALFAPVGFVFRWCAEQLEGMIPGNPRFTLPIICIIVPLFWYSQAPVILDSQKIYLSDDKGNTYYLWPPKTNSFRDWNDQVLALMETVPPRSPVLTDWNYFHLLDYYRQRMYEPDHIIIINLRRHGSPLRPTYENWAAFTRTYLVENADKYARVYALGEIPDMTNDPLYRTHFSTPGFYVYELAGIKYQGLYDFEILSYQYETMIRRNMREKVTPRRANSIWLRPFYDNNGFELSVQKSNRALWHFMRLSGREFPAALAKKPGAIRPVPLPDPPWPGPPDDWPLHRPPIY
jgi:hypothetical protein